MIIKYLVLCLCVCWCCITSAQTPVFKNLTEDDGLPDNEIYDGIEDSKGFLWFSTNGGLVKYNGRRFKPYTHPSQRNKSYNILGLDKNNVLWVGNFGGQLFFLWQDSLVELTALNPFKFANTLTFCFDKDNNIYLSSSQGFYKGKPIHKANEKPQYVIEQISNEGCSAVFYDEQYEQVYIVPQRLNKNYQYITTYKNNILGTVPVVMPANKYINSCLFFVYNGQVHLYTRITNYIGRFNGKEFEPINFPTDKLSGIIRIVPAKDELLICTNQGAYTYNKNGELLKYEFGPDGRFSGVVVNKTNQYFLHTLNKGLFILPNNGTQTLNSLSNFTSNDITYLSQAGSNSFYIGNNKGEVHLFKNNKVTLALPSEANKYVDFIWSDSATNYIIWNAMSSRIFNSKQANYNNTKNQRPNAGYGIKDVVSIPGTEVLAVANSNDISLINLQDAVGKYLPLTNKWAATYQIDSLYSAQEKFVIKSIILARGRGRCVYYDTANQAVWGGNVNGLFIFTAAGQKEITYQGEKVLATDIIALNGKQYVSTINKGIFVMQGGFIVKQLSTTNGLGSNTLYNLHVHNNHIWGITDKGLQFIDPVNEFYFIYDKQDGLPSYKINGIAFANNLVYVATSKGLYTVPTNQPIKKTPPVPAILENIIVNGKTITDLNITQFKPGDNNITFAINAPYSNYAANIIFKYRLVGLDDSFYTLKENQYEIPYKNLPSGNYSFEVYAVNKNGIPSKEPFKYSFTIEKKLIQKTWFLILSFAAIIGLLYLLLRYMVGREKRRQAEKIAVTKLENELQKSTLASIKAQMNPHFMFNALNTIQSYIFTNDKNAANTYLSKFSELMRMILDMSNKEKILLQEEIQAITLYIELEQMRFDAGFSYQIKTANNIEPHDLEIPSMLIQPYVENSIKHGLLHKKGDKLLTIAFSKDEEQNVLAIIITDNGVGRAKSEEINAKRPKKHKSFSTEANAKRLEILNKGAAHPISVTYTDLYTEPEQQPAGTQVTLYIPLGSK
jgi:two-component sensor histidine kinase